MASPSATVLVHEVINVATILLGQRRCHDGLERVAQAEIVDRQVQAMLGAGDIGGQAVGHVLGALLALGQERHRQASAIL